ncbi:MAG: GFA family protein [Pseudomonadota bacterium]
MNTGGCLCGEIRYEFEQDSCVMALHCHCKDCQRVTGSGKATVVMFPRESVTISGAYKTFANSGTDGSHVKRGFCPTCGSQMFTFVEEIPDHVFIKAGTMDDSEWVSVSLNCWESSASAWSPPDAAVEGVDKNPPTP